MAVRFNKNFNVNRVVKRLVRTILALYVGGTVISTFGNVMNATCSPFYSGLSLIGWTVENAYCAANAAATDNTISSTSGSGVLAVVGIIAIAQIVTDFISW